MYRNPIGPELPKAFGQRKPPKFVCTQCQDGNCESCIDVLRAVMQNAQPICKCARRGHDGEPVEQQVSDPFTGSVHGPGLEVTDAGEIRRRG